MTARLVTLHATLLAARADLLREIRSLDLALVGRRPAADEWSIAENVLHIADMDRQTVGHIRRILREDEPSLPPTRGDEFAAERAAAVAAGWEAVVTRLETARDELLALCDGLDEDALARGGIHPKFGRRTVAGWLEQRAKHDRDHQEQIHATWAIVQATR